MTTLTELKAEAPHPAQMTPEAQRIAIAKACGWKRPDDPYVMSFKQGWTMPEKWWMCPNGVLRFAHDMPDYLNDLNAMHEAEKVLSLTQFWEYADRLNALVDGSKGKDSYICATAAQRAEAFLRTLGLWKNI